MAIIPRSSNRVAWGKVIHAFIKAGWNPPRPSEKATRWIIEDIGDFTQQHPTHTLALAPSDVRIVMYLSHGLGREEIAHHLNVSPETVKHHLRGMYRRLGAQNAAHAVAIALRSNVID